MLLFKIFAVERAATDDVENRFIAADPVLARVVVVDDEPDLVVFDRTRERRLRRANMFKSKKPEDPY